MIFQNMKQTFINFLILMASAENSIKFKREKMVHLLKKTEDLQNERKTEKVASISQSLCGSSYQDYWGYEINCTSTIVSKISWKFTKKFYFYVPLRTI